MIRLRRPAQDISLDVIGRSYSTVIWVEDLVKIWSQLPASPLRDAARSSKTLWGEVLTE